ncbi:TonB family protein [Lysobacter sp. A3-1-A15]
MLVTGSVDIEADGSVSAYEADEPGRLPPAVVQLLGSAVPNWRFQPIEIEGRPARVQTRASILVHAHKAPDDGYLLSIARASFGSSDDADMPTAKRLTPPRYPSDLVRAGVGGTVYLMVKVARDGSVADAMVEQVNLRTVAKDSAMQRMRDQFAESALAGTRRWTFNPPVEPDASPYWVVRVPVHFVAPDASVPKYGDWSAYVPGPRALAPWAGVEDMDAPDTLVPGGVYRAGKQGPELLTPLGSPGS